MASQGDSGIARRRANIRRGAVGALVLICFVVFTGYFRESDGGPLHGVQTSAAAATAPLQSIASRAIEPLRDAWGWVSSLKDARDRAAALEDEVEVLRGAVADDAVRDQRLAELERLLGVEALVDAGGELGGYAPVTGLVIGRSISDWYRAATIDVGRADGVVVNSPVVAGGFAGAALAGVVISASDHTATIAFITDGRTEVGATIPAAGAFPGLLQSTTPGQLRLTGVPRAARVELNQDVVTAGFATRGLLSIYPPGIPIGQVTSVGSREVDVEQTVQVTPYIDPRDLHHLVVLAPQSDRAKRRASG